ncbi:MAG: hypothetical protein KJO79_02445 [Verrucomicrobiae bacterium]|nr:hypothetical protein [Verrucomicrobiae bacterium]NNJ86014.1 hypothetical protein [Akkermansiaceae bacterium]
MNKFTLTLQAVLDALKTTIGQLFRRLFCLLQRKAYDPNPGPQWQQLELPFTRTPVKRWNR